MLLFYACFVFDFANDRIMLIDTSVKRFSVLVHEPERMKESERKKRKKKQEELVCTGAC